MKPFRLMLVGWVFTVAAAAGELTAGWQALANYRAGQSLQVFDRALAEANPAVAREARFGRGVALLDKQPVAESQVEEARTLFIALADSGTDSYAQGARFFLGRIAQHHLPQPNPAEAGRQFRQLIAEHEDSVWAQTALSRLALLEIYEINPLSPPATRIGAVEQLLVHARTPAAQSELHLAIADAIFFYRLPPVGALSHLLAAERLGRLDWAGRMDVLVQIAELSRLAGNRPQAAQFYRIFLKENPRDLRNYIVKERLAEMEKLASGR